jgi:pectin methylesterase-like acyl-CoA thioesterase
MNFRKLTVASAVTLALVLGVMLITNFRASAAVMNRYVANGGSDTSDCSSSSTPCATIQYAVGQSSANDTINVAAGIYTENVNIPTGLTGLTLKGAQAGNAVGGRTFGGVGESTVISPQVIGNNGVITIRPSGVTVDGFSITNAKLAVGSVTAVGAAQGIVVKNTVNGAVITNNIFDGISTVDTSGNGTAQAVYLEAGPDNVQILNNRMTNIQSSRSAKGVLNGDSNSTDPGTNILIQGNLISNVTSGARGAYGVQVNNGGPGNGGPGITANTGLRIHNNTISNLNSGGSC